LINITDEGLGKLIGWFDPDENRQWIMKNKSKAFNDKRMNEKEAVKKLSPFPITGYARRTTRFPEVM